MFINILQHTELCTYNNNIRNLSDKSVFNKTNYINIKSHTNGFKKSYTINLVRKKTKTYVNVLMNGGKTSENKQDLTGDGGVMKNTVKEGTGVEADYGTTVKVNYIGKLENGQIFDSSYTRNEPYTFTIGNGKVIKGWEIGVKSMKIGEKSEFLIFPDYAYKKKGIPPIIPPNAKLTFEIELIDVIRSGENKSKIENFTPKVARTPEDISNEFKEKMQTKANLSKKKGFDDFFFISPFKSQSGEKAPWWLNPNITFVIVFILVFLLFFIISSVGGIHQGYVDTEFNANVLN